MFHLASAQFEASDADMRSMEHLFESLTPASTMGAELKKAELEVNKKISALNGKPLTAELEEEARRIVERVLTLTVMKRRRVFSRASRNTTTGNVPRW